jgi:hypothetical protein
LISFHRCTIAVEGGQGQLHMHAKGLLLVVSGRCEWHPSTIEVNMPVLQTTRCLDQVAIEPGDDGHHAGGRFPVTLQIHTHSYIISGTGYASIFMPADGTLRTGRGRITMDHNSQLRWAADLGGALFLR